MSNAATRERLQALWQQVADALLEYFRETPPGERAAAWLDLCRAFLKDNNMTLDQMPDPRRAEERLQELHALSRPFSARESPCLCVGDTTPSSENTTEEPPE